MPDRKPALTGAERKARHDRRLRSGLLYTRTDRPPEIGEWLIVHGFMADDNSTGKCAETLPTGLRLGSKPDISASEVSPAPDVERGQSNFGL